MKSVITANDDSLLEKIFTQQYLEVTTSVWFILSYWIMSKHFESYVTITGIVGEKRIDLVYRIKNFDLSKEVAVVSVFSDNIQYEFREPQNVECRTEIR